MNTSRFADVLASAYLRTKGSRPSPVEARVFRQWLATQFNRIRGIVDFTPDEVSPEQMTLVHAITGRLLISTAHNVHPHWLPVENAQFRAVHDWHHISGGHGFDLMGELGAYQEARSTAPQEIWWILHSEILLQAAAAIRCGCFQRQKLVRL